MARGRIITNEITKDRQVNELSNDTSRLAFTWLVTFADKEGRTYGDPALVRSMLFPRRDDISIELMEGFIREWQAAGFIEWYEAGGDKWIYFIGFAKNQPGLRKEKEPASRIAPPPDQAGQAADDTPDGRRNDAEKAPDIPDKRMEGNGMEGNAGKKPPATLDEWLGKLDGEPVRVRNATIVSLFRVLYPERRPPGYGKVGKMAKQFKGGHGELCSWLWENAESPPSGDILAYCLACAKRDAKRPQRDMKHDIAVIKEAKKLHGKDKWKVAADWLDDYQIDMVEEAGGWHTLCGMYANASDAALRDAWFRLREKQ